MPAKVHNKPARIKVTASQNGCYETCITYFEISMLSCCIDSQTRNLYFFAVQNVSLRRMARLHQSRKASSTPSRKKQHVELIVSRDVRFRKKTTGLENLEFVNNALPEVNLSDIDTSTNFLGQTIRLPFLISCMTGGYAEALQINRRLAEICEELRIPMGVGSQRQATEDATYRRTFGVVREVAPTIPIIGNIGATEVARLQSPDVIRRLIDLVRADAFAIHLNPLQELLQPEGNTDFDRVLEGITVLVENLHVPVVVKEIGAGLSVQVVQRLLDAGVRHIDIAGAGGTSWAGVETMRSREREFATQFWDWGIPTASALRDIAVIRSRVPPFTLIASGGVTNGMDAAKCIALGADLVGTARPVLQTLHSRKKKGVRDLLTLWEKTLRGVMFLTGSRTLKELQNVPLVRY